MNGRATELRRINPALAHSWGVVRNPAIDRRVERRCSDGLASLRQGRYRVVSYAQVKEVI